MSVVELHFDFSCEQNPQLGLSPDQIYRIRSDLAGGLKLCGYNIQEMHRMFDWEHSGCHCDADTYNEDEHKLYITLFIDWPPTPPALGAAFIVVVVPMFVRFTEEHGVHVNMSVIGKTGL